MKKTLWISLIIILIYSSCTEKKMCNCQCHSVDNVVDTALIPRLYIIDEYADSIYYRGEWYYLDAYNLNWVSRYGDRIKDHIIEREINWDKHSVVFINGEPLELWYSPIRLDEYGDTIVYKHKEEYF